MRGATSPTSRRTGNSRPPDAEPAAPASDADIASLLPEDENKPFDVLELIDTLVDADSFLEVHKRWAKELVVGYARIEGRVVGILANQPKQRGGVLFVDSSDKAARFIWTCNAFNIPLLFLADVPGFMIGTQVERAGIIRAGAKMISAVSEATVPKLSVIIRKAYGAGLYAMAGPAYEPDGCIALPGRSDRGDGALRPRSTRSTTTRSRRSRTRPSGRRSSRSCAPSTARRSTSSTWRRRSWWTR